MTLHSAVPRRHIARATKLLTLATKVYGSSVRDLSPATTLKSKVIKYRSRTQEYFKALSYEQIKSSPLTPTRL